MSDTRVRIKRQIELLGLVIAEPGKYTIQDLEFYFDCTEITIKRDLRELRSMGIDIHSIPKKGLVIQEAINPSVIKELLGQYIITSGIDNAFIRSVNFLANKFNDKAISHFTIIQTNIERNTRIEIEYKKNIGNAEEKVIDPLLIFLDDNEWRLLANNSGAIKQYLLSKIIRVKALGKTFPEKLKENIKKKLSASFGNWLSDEVIEVKLKFTKQWLASGKEPNLMEEQQTKTEEDGSKIVSFKINSLEELARWITARGGDVIVIEPSELKNLVIKLASNTVKANNT